MLSWFLLYWGGKKRKKNETMVNYLEEMYRFLYVIPKKAICWVPSFLNPIIKIRTPHQSTMPQEPNGAYWQTNCTTCIADPILSYFPWLSMFDDLKHITTIKLKFKMLSMSLNKPTNINRTTRNKSVLLKQVD